MRPLKLCFLGWGGHVHLVRWASYFAAADHDVSVISLEGKGHYPPGVRQYVARCARRHRALADTELRLLLWRLKPDLLHVHWAPFAVRAARVWSGPLAVTAWGSDIYRLGEFPAKQQSAVSQALADADFITCDSEDLARAITERIGVAEVPVQLIQWGVQTDRFAPGPSAFAHTLGIAGRPVVFSARNFNPIYNQETVVDAFAIVRRALPSAFLLMKNYAGDPSYLRSLQERITGLGLNRDCHIVETVPYEQMPDLYRAAQVTVSIPLSDATPMALLEAMACGSLPVVSDLPSLREWIVEGENGYLVAARDTESIARCMIEGLTDEPFRVRAAARNRALVQARASQAAHMERCEQLYRRAIFKERPEAAQRA